MSCDTSNASIWRPPPQIIKASTDHPLVTQLRRRIEAFTYAKSRYNYGGCVGDRQSRNEAYYASMQALHTFIGELDERLKSG